MWICILFLHKSVHFSNKLSGILCIWICICFLAPLCWISKRLYSYKEKSHTSILVQKQLQTQENNFFTFFLTSWNKEKLWWECLLGLWCLWNCNKVMYVHFQCRERATRYMHNSCTQMSNVRNLHKRIDLKEILLKVLWRLGTNNATPLKIFISLLLKTLLSKD